MPRGQEVQFPSNGGTASGYLAEPDAGRGPGVIVIQEWWGLNDQIRRTADRFAQEGLTALAPDFYHGQAARIGEPDDAGKLMMALNIDQAARDARGAAAYLAQRTGGRVGVIGFCMGGQLALMTGTVAPEHVAAVVDMYGIHPNVKPDYSQMRAAVLAVFAEKDEMVDDAARQNLAQQLQANGVRYQSHVYPGVDHAFMNDDRPEVYEPATVQDAWRRILDFFRTELAGATT
jgi:carboxymethylenebutenolidase